MKDTDKARIEEIRVRAEKPRHDAETLAKYLDEEYERYLERILIGTLERGTGWKFFLPLAHARADAPYLLTLVDRQARMIERVQERLGNAERAILDGSSIAHVLAIITSTKDDLDRIESEGV